MPEAGVCPLAWQYHAFEEFYKWDDVIDLHLKKDTGSNHQSEGWESYQKEHWITISDSKIREVWFLNRPKIY